MKNFLVVTESGSGVNTQFEVWVEPEDEQGYAVEHMSVLLNKFNFMREANEYIREVLLNNSNLECRYRF